MIAPPAWWSRVPTAFSAGPLSRNADRPRSHSRPASL